MSESDLLPRHFLQHLDPWKKVLPTISWAFHGTGLGGSKFSFLHLTDPKKSETLFGLLVYIRSFQPIHISNSTNHSNKNHVASIRTTPKLQLHNKKTRSLWHFFSIFAQIPCVSMWFVYLQLFKLGKWHNNCCRLGCFFSVVSGSQGPGRDLKETKHGANCIFVNSLV